MKYIHLKLLLFIYVIFGQAPDTLWTKYFDSGWGFDVSITLDGGNIISGTDMDSYGIIIKTDIDGQEEWRQVYTNSNFLRSVKQSNDGGYICIGDFYNDEFEKNLVVNKLNSNGEIEWTQNYTGVFGESIIETMDGGYVFVGQKDDEEFNQQRLIVKIDLEGNIIWESIDGDIGWDSAHSIIETNDGGLLITGREQPWQELGICGFLLKINNDGNHLWNRRFYSEDSIATLEFRDLDVTDNGGIILTGWMELEGYNHQILLLKTNENGIEEWRKIEGDIERDRGHSVKATSNDGYVITGFRTNTDFNNDFTIIKYNSLGEILWESLIDSENNENEKGYSIDITSENNYVGLGYGYKNGIMNIYLVKLAPETLSSDINKKVILTNIKLNQNYPNPFNPMTTIRYELSEATNVTISIYDMMGREVKNLINTNQNSGYKSVIWNGTNDNGEMVSGGMYFYSIKTNTFSQTKKMIFLK